MVFKRKLVRKGRWVFTPRLGCLVNMFSFKNIDIKFFNIVVGDESASLQAHWFRSEGKIHLSAWHPEVWNRKNF